MAKLKKASRAFRRFRRMFSMRRNEVARNDTSLLSTTRAETQEISSIPPSSTNNYHDSSLLFSPEEVLSEIHGKPVSASLYPEVVGRKFLLEVGGRGTESQGWILDFARPAAVVTTYDVVPSAKGEPPVWVHKSIEPLPWMRYQNRKVFSDLEQGKLSEMTAYLRGKIRFAGDAALWDALGPLWTAAKERAQEHRASQKPLARAEAGLGQGHLSAQEIPENLVDSINQESENDDEEARIIAMFRPNVEPINPCTKAFWKRHFGTDALVSSYLYVLSSIFYVLQAGLQFWALVTLPSADPSRVAHAAADTLGAVMFLVASVYFIKLSYPETTMIMAYRAMTRDPAQMPFLERYVTANEMLVALWVITGAVVVPNLLVATYEGLVLRQESHARTDLGWTLVALPLLGVFNVSAMPDAMRANGGRGSSFFFDGFWSPLLCLNSGKKRTTSTNSHRRAFWRKHLGNDALVTAWVFALLGVTFGAMVVPLVIASPQSTQAWLTFWATLPFSVGSLLMLRSSYPENANASIFFPETGNDGTDATEEEDSSLPTSYMSI